MQIGLRGPEMTRPLLRNSALLAELQALAAADAGPITYCPPGVARAHEAKPQAGP